MVFQLLFSISCKIEVITLPVVLGGAISLGFFVAKALKGILINQSVGVAVFGGGVVLATVKGLSKSVPSIFDFIKEPSFKTLSVPAVAIFIASFSLFASFYVCKNKLPQITSTNFVTLNLSSEEISTPPPVIDKNISTLFLNLTQPIPSIITDSKSIITFYITFEGEATTEALNKKEGPGVSIHEADQNLLKSLLKDLSECSDDKNSRVKIEIVGFSSSSDWANEKPEDSEEKNLELANIRAEKVADFFTNHADGDWLDIDLKRWANIGDMIKELKFNDRLIGRYSERMGRLTRRVEIRLKDLAKCQS